MSFYFNQLKNLQLYLFFFSEIVSLEKPPQFFHSEPKTRYRSGLIFLSEFSQPITWNFSSPYRKVKNFETRAKYKYYLAFKRRQIFAENLSFVHLWAKRAKETFYIVFRKFFHLFFLKTEGKIIMILNFPS